MSGIQRAGMVAADGGVLVVIAASILGALPTIAGVLGVIYYAFLIWENATFQKIIGKLSQHLARKQAKKALDAGAPLVVIQTPAIPADAVVAVQSDPQEPASLAPPSP